MKDDPLTKLENVQEKVANYFRKNPGEDRLPDDLARELVERTRDYVDYQERQRQEAT
jgi:hypothetical protein